MRWRSSRARAAALLIVVVAAGSLLAGGPAYANVEKWKQFRAQYSNTSWSGNPFDLDLTATFTHTSSGRQLTQFGFYAGNNLWKIYFMPDALGEWTYVTSSPDADLNGHSGSFTCVASQLDGMLVPNGKRWKLSDGPFDAPLMISVSEWWNSEETTNCGHSSGRCPGDLIQWAHDTAGARIIGTTLHVPVAKAQPSNPYDLQAIGTTFNLDYWDKLNSHLDMMASLNIGFYAMFFADDADVPWTNTGSTLNEMDIRFFKYAVARLGAYPIIMWDTGIDIGEYRSNAWVEAFAQWFVNNDPWVHPVGNRHGGGSGSIDPASATYKSDGSTASVTHSTTVSTWNASTKPVAYTDRWRDGGCSRGLPRASLRRLTWETILVGGTAVYYGDCEGASGGYLSENYESTFEIAPDLGHIQNFVVNETISFGTLVPHDELVVANPSAVQALAADPGLEYVAYLDAGGTIGLNLSAAGGPLAASWYDPLTGNKTSAGTVQSPGANESFSAPSSNPWVLHLQGNLDETPPSPPQGLTAVTVNDDRIDLSWSASSDPESGISAYRVYRDSVLVGETGETTYSDTGLEDSSTYVYTVSAVNGAGLESAPSAPDAATTAADTTPPTIVDVQAVGVPDTVLVSFSESVEPSGATLASNYGIDNGVTVLSAAMNGDSTVELTTSDHTDGVTYTLTVNGVTDTAVSPNTIAANSQRSYVYIAQLSVTNVTAQSGEAYQVGEALAIGSTTYIDRNFTYLQIPVSIAGAKYILTANGDKLVAGDTFLSFDVNQPVTVWVAHDDRFALKPTWLQSWPDTGEDVDVNTSMSLFSKEFPDGTITLGGNVNPAEAEDNNMYTVIIAPAEAPQVPPQPPTALAAD